MNGARLPTGKSIRAERGMGLATALFVITIMALLSVLIMQLVRSNAETMEEEILLLRSFYAAQAGAEYGLNRALPPDGSASACPAVSNTNTVFPTATIDVDGLTPADLLRFHDASVRGTSAGGLPGRGDRDFHPGCLPGLCGTHQRQSG
jgi:hypothetical protein